MEPAAHSGWSSLWSVPPPATSWSEYHVEAAIAWCHASALTAQATNWAQIVTLYDTLLRIRPSPVIELNRAIAVAQHAGPSRAHGKFTRSPAASGCTRILFIPWHSASWNCNAAATLLRTNTSASHCHSPAIQRTAIHRGPHKRVQLSNLTNSVVSPWDPLRALSLNRLRGTHHLVHSHCDNEYCGFPDRSADHGDEHELGRPIAYCNLVWTLTGALQSGASGSVAVQGDRSSKVPQGNCGQRRERTSTRRHCKIASTMADQPNISF